MHKRSRQGFTLMEMLIVVAIIAVLVAIAIPTFSSSLHKAREATDLANTRAYFAELQADYMMSGEYQTRFDPDPWLNWTDTITFSDGATVKLKTGILTVRRPTDDETSTGSKLGYQVTYVCQKCGETHVFGS